ncbi:RHS repeat-associated core domain-containing protein [Pseudomonas fluorescens]|uniref:Uncharacterized protein n=1 Tax=Pseudomonas fluorescens TaxID=294 RepID=A0A5E7DQD0_PSEFL|nr:RHS repeat-associated core domain-containing protein [Pseudomonas fluorescens]VVO19839.1 hypothetical protein PS723_04115 [Pseudomonas fluorescens]
MLHAHTPTLKMIDPRGLAVRAVAYHRGSTLEARISRQTYDAAGRATHSHDPRLFKLLEREPQARANLSRVFSLSGSVLLSDSVDAGWRLSLAGEAGQWLESWDQKLNHSRIDYDHLLRPMMGYEQPADEPERRSACFTYAEPTAESASRNQCGQLIRHDDTAGTRHFPEFSLAGASLAQTRYFLEDYETCAHWPEAVADRDLLLETTGATTRFSYDAAGELFSQTDAQGNIQSFSQTIAGQLRETHLKLAEGSALTLVSAIQYNAFGQIERQTAGNNVVSCATYSALDGRLQQLKAQVPGQAALQDLRYDYDPVGNPLKVRDAAQPVRYFRNQRIEALNTYEYDTLYQLTKATGRQAINGLIGPQLPAFQSPADPSQLENYTQTFRYDPGGNLDVLVHTAASQNQTRRMGTSTFSNRSLPEKADGELPTEAEIAAGFDANGNPKLLQPGQPLGWDVRNQLCRVDQVVREEGPHDAEIYLYDGSGQRQRKIRSAYTGTLTRTHEVRYLPGLEIRTSPDETLYVLTVQAGRSTVQVLHWEKGRPPGIADHQQRYNLSDHLGSSTLELDENAGLISQEWFYPYGGTACRAGRDKVEASYKTLRYSGKERDATGLYYYGFRYYAPWWPRWINPDPAGAADGLNLYAMVHGNPLRYVDIQGLSLSEAAQAGGASLLRETTAATVGAGVRYGAAALLSSFNPVNWALTLIGALIGAAMGAVVGAGVANWAQSNTGGHSSSSSRQWAWTIVGAILGASIGTAPSLIGHFIAPGINSPAIATIASLPGSFARELTFQSLNHLGPSNPWDRFPELRTFVLGTFAAMVAAGMVGAAGGLLLPANDFSVNHAIEGIVVAGVATGSGVAASSVVRGTSAKSTFKKGRGGGPKVNGTKLLIGTATRGTFATLGQLIGIPLAEVISASDPILGNALTRSITSGIGGNRLAVKTAVDSGLSGFTSQNTAEFSHDIEMADITGAGVTGTGVPTSAAENTMGPSDPQVIHGFSINEPRQGQRRYSL